MSTTGTRARMLGRQEFLRAGAAALAAASLAGCDLLSTKAAKDKAPAPGKGAANGKQAPMLANLTEQGKLPPVERRIPANPLVVEPADRLGSYGGTWHTVLVGGDDDAWLRRTVGYENLLRYNLEWTGVIPNLAEKIDASPDATKYTVKLRKGTRWSDGTPFTADDLVFWYEDVFMNKELTPVPDPMYVAGGKPLVVEKVDDVTVVFRFAAPNSLLLEYLASGAGSEPITYPRHYLEKFHKKYNPDGIDDLVKDAEFEDWIALFGAKADHWTNTDIPVLHAWKLTTAYGATTTQVKAERNPYYWKVDPKGNQLPYLDKVVFDMANDLEVVLLKAQNGDLDMHARHINTLVNKPLLAKARPQGDFDFFELIPDPMNSSMIALNLTHKDPVKREIFQNKDFRIGLSYAINRPEIIKTIYKGQGKPWQSSPRERTGYYSESLATQYIEYDVAKANEYLDRAGYDRRAGDGMRLGPDGKTISITAEVTAAEGPEWPDLMELVVRYWRNVGVDARMRNMNRSLIEERRDASLQDVSVTLAYGGINVIMDPRWYFPHDGNENAVLWANWYASGGSDGEKPPGPIREQMRLYDQLRASGDQATQEKLMKRILDIAADEFYAIGITLPPNGYGIVKNSFHNVPKHMFDGTSSAWPMPSTTNPCQYFTDERD